MIAVTSNCTKRRPIHSRDTGKNKGGPLSLCKKKDSNNLTTQTDECSVFSLCASTAAVPFLVILSVGLTHARRKFDKRVAFGALDIGAALFAHGTTRLLVDVGRVRRCKHDLAVHTRHGTLLVDAGGVVCRNDTVLLSVKRLLANFAWNQGGRILVLGPVQCVRIAIHVFVHVSTMLAQTICAVAKDVVFIRPIAGVHCTLEKAQFADVAVANLLHTWLAHKQLAPIKRLTECILWVRLATRAAIKRILHRHTFAVQHTDF